MWESRESDAWETKFIKHKTNEWHLATTRDTWLRLGQGLAESKSVYLCYGHKLESVYFLFTEFH